MFSNCKYLVFGSRGVGKEVTRRLCAGGARVHVCSRREESLVALKEDIQSDRVSVSVCDVKQSANISDAVLGACEKLGGLLNGVAFAVGSIPLKPFRRVTRSELVEHFELNTCAALEIVQAAAPELEKTRGAVVLFSTVAASRGFRNHAIIAAAKGALEAITVQMAAELAPAVRVNCISASLMNSSLSHTILNAKNAPRKQYESAHPLNRIGETDDAAAMAAFLLSKDATWITGQVISVDGGRSTVYASPGKP